MISKTFLLGLAAAVVSPLLLTAQTPPAGDWPTWGHDPGGQRFSPLGSIDRGNVQSLKVAWTFRTGDAYQPKNSKPTAFEATPIYIDGTIRLIPQADFDREEEANGRDLSGGWEFARQRGTPFGMARRFLRAPGGWPCTPPPWGTLNAIDADTGAVKWTVPLGDYVIAFARAQ